MPVVTRDATSGWWYPASSAEVTSLYSGRSIPAPVHGYQCQEAAGNLADFIGSLALVKFNSPSFQTAFPNHTRKAIGYQANNDCHYYSPVTANDVGDISTVSTTVLMFAANAAGLGSAPPTTGPKRRINLGTGANARGLQWSTTPKFEVAGTGQTTGTGTASPGTAAHPIIFQVNRTAGAIVAQTDQETIAPTYTAPGGGAGYLSIGPDALGDGGNTIDLVGYMLMWAGASAELTAAQRASIIDCHLNGPAASTIAVTPATPTITGLGSTRQMTATVTRVDTSTYDGTATVAWSSSNPAVATVNSSGLVTSVGAGSTTITATFTSLNASAATGTTSVTVSAVAPTLVGLLNSHSQVVGQGDTDKSDPFLALTAPLAAVQYNKRYSGSVTDPMVRTTFGTTSMQPYHAGGSAGMGIELTLARELVKLGLTAAVISDAINGSTAEQWKPSHAVDTSGKNLFQQGADYATTQEAAFGATLSVIVLWQGENDANTLTDANNFAANFAAMVAAHRAARPSVKIIVPLLSNNNTATYRATVRAAQESVIAANSTFMLGVKHDDLPLADGVHLTANSYSTLGQRVAFAMATLLGVSRPVNAGPAPAYVGGPPVVFGAGDLVPPSYPGQLDKDKELLFVLTAINNVAPSLSVAAGFSLVGVIPISVYVATYYIRCAVYARDVDAAQFIDGRMPPPTVHGANTMNLAVCHTFRGITNGPVQIDSAIDSVNNNYATSWSGPTGVITTHANALVVQPFGGFTGSSLNTAAIVDATLSAYSKLGSGVYNVGTDYLIWGMATGTLAAPGATGAATVTTATNAILAGHSIALWGVSGAPVVAPRTPPSIAIGSVPGIGFVR